MRRTQDAKTMNARGQGNGAREVRTRSFRFDDNIFHRLIQQTMIKRLKPNPYFFHFQFSVLLVI
jgi:hypothetical protein